MSLDEERHERRSSADRQLGMSRFERLSVGGLAVARAVEATQLRQVVPYRSETAQDSPDEIGPFGAVVDAFRNQLEFPEERLRQSRNVRCSRDRLAPLFEDRLADGFDDFLRCADGKRRIGLDTILDALNLRGQMPAFERMGSGRQVFEDGRSGRSHKMIIYP